MSKEFTLVVVANENTSPRVVSGNFMSDSEASFQEAMELAVEKAKTYLDASYKFVAVGLSERADTDKLKGINVMASPVWLNGHLTNLGKEWS